MDTKQRLAISLAILIMLGSQFAGCATGRINQTAPQKPCAAAGCPAPQHKY